MGGNNPQRVTAPLSRGRGICGPQVEFDILQTRKGYLGLSLQLSRLFVSSTALVNAMLLWRCRLVFESPGVEGKRSRGC